MCVCVGGGQHDYHKNLPFAAELFALFCLCPLFLEKRQAG